MLVVIKTSLTVSLSYQAIRGPDCNQRFFSAFSGGEYWCHYPKQLSVWFNTRCIFRRIPPSYVLNEHVFVCRTLTRAQCVLVYFALLFAFCIMSQWLNEAFFFIDVGKLDLIVNVHLYVQRSPLITWSFNRLFTFSDCFLLKRNQISLELPGYAINVNCI